VSLVYDRPERVAFFARNMDVDPVAHLAGLDLPVLALFGGADDIIPVPESVTAFAPHTAGLAVFPGADHGLFTADPAPGVPRLDQLAPGVLPLLTAFLAG